MPPPHQPHRPLTVGHAVRDDVRITGCGWVSPLGDTPEALDAALDGAISAVTAMHLDLAGLVPVTVPVARCAFDESAWRTPSRLPADRGTAMALAAAHDATRRAGLDAAALDPHRVGIYWGSGMGGAATFDATCRALYATGTRMRPTSVITAMPNAPLAELALKYGARGAALGYACACASSAVAIGEALRAIRGGWIDVAIAGGSESMLTPGIVATWQAMRVLAPVTGDDASTACRPFAADRAGFALGEGAGAVVLESRAHAERRGAAPRLSLAGYATNCDAVHITNPDAGGQMRAMRTALADAGITAADVGYVNAHGTATVAGDAAEAASVREVFGGASGGVPVGSTKALHGHLLGAGGAFELIVALRALETGRLPPNGAHASLDPAFDLLLAGKDMRLADARRCVVSNSFAFGGTNAVLVAALA